MFQVIMLLAKMDVCTTRIRATDRDRNNQKKYLGDLLAASDEEKIKKF